MQNLIERPKVSVIIPVYNAENYLKECLDSILKQTLQEIEVICVNDGSSDGSLSILNEYVKEDSRLKIISQENQGAGSARNNGLKYAKGLFVIFLDCDDIFEHNMLEIMYSKAILLNLDVCVCRSDQFNNDTKDVKDSPWTIKKELLPLNEVFSSKDVKKDFFNLFVWWPWDKLYRKSFLDKQNIQFQILRTTNDLYFVACTMLSANRISYVDNVLAHHRIHIGNSLENTRAKSWWCFYEALIAVRHFMEEKGLYDRFKLDFINYSLDFSLWQISTLQGPSYYKLRSNLCNKWFDDLGINSVDKESFYNSHSFEIKCKLEEENLKFDRQNANDLPKVTVVIPCLNSIDYLCTCVDSVINQTLSNIEIICVDAGSTDGTLETLQEYAAIDHRIHIIHSPKKSYGYQMNLGFQAARGEYIGIVEPDDYVEPVMFEKLYNLAKSNHLDLAKSGFFNHYSEPVARDIPARIPPNAPKDVFCPLDSKFTESSQFFGMSPSIWTGLYRADFIRSKNIKFTETPGASYQDTAFTFKVWCCAKRAKFIDECLLHYRRDNDNSSSNSRGKVYCVVDEYQEEERFLSDEQPEIKDRAEGIRCRLKYGAYLWNYRRLVMPEKLEFLKYAAKEFADDMESGYFIQKYFSEYQWNELKSIIRDYRAFDIVSCNGNKWKPEDRISVMRFISLFNEKQDCLNGERGFQLVKPNSVDSPLVSVVIPVYNSREFIMDCVNSIREQNLKQIEIICVDDGSTDDSLHALLQLAFEDERISVYTEKNCGQGIARNNAAHTAKGKYLYFMDSDDLLAPEALGELCQRMTVDDLDVIYFDADSFGSQDADMQKLLWYKQYYHRLHQYNGIYSGIELMSLMQENNEYRVSPVLQMLRTDFYRESQLSFPEGIIHEDNAFTFKSMFLANRAGYSNKRYYRRRVRRGSTMTGRLSWNNAYGYFKCFLIMLDFLKGQDANSLPKEIYEILAAVYRNGRDAYSTIPWVERQTQLALPELEKSLMKLYYEAWVAISWKKELEKRKALAVKSDISKAAYDHLLFDFNAMQNSVSFRIGRKITWAPRKIRNAGRCFKQHGAVYTMKRVIEHFGIDMGTGDFKK